MATLSFNLLNSSPTRFGPRVGQATFKRAQGGSQTVETPGLLTCASRGIISHLSRDHHHQTKAIKWINIPFESFLEQSPPILTKLPGPHPLHSFLGYSTENHIISMSLRDPANCDEMPPNGKDFVSAKCVRGVRKVTSSEWKRYTAACKPDIVIALSDTMVSSPPYSQKRVTKSIERSCAWLLDLLSPQSSAPPIVLVHLAGGSSIPARHAFSSTLQERLYGQEAEALRPLESLDEGLTGYVFDLAPMRLQVAAEDCSEDPQPSAHESKGNKATPPPSMISRVQNLCKASLTALSGNKITIANSANSPHEILRLIQGVGIDLFDAQVAQKAANVGVSLDFCFPVPPKDESTHIRQGLKQDIGHNLYNNLYTHDFSALSSRDCDCLSCQPSPPTDYITHSSVDRPSFGSQTGPTGFTKGYVHHLLHTHEMSAHSMLVMHNLTILDNFFAGIRHLISQGEDAFNSAVDDFYAHYDEDLAILEEATVMCDMVDKARGKGRLSREKEKQVAGELLVEA